MEIKTAKIDDDTSCENHNITSFSNNAADSIHHSHSSGSVAIKCNQTDDLESELKKFITDNEALGSISADHDKFSVQENDVVQTPLQRQWNEFGEAINEDYKPLRATFPQVTLADNKDSNQEKTVSTLQSLQEQWKKIDEECSPYSAQNIKMTQIKAEREELLETMKRLTLTSPGSALNPKFEKLNDLDKRRADLQTVIDSNISKKNDLEYKLRTNAFPQVTPVQEPSNFKTRCNNWLALRPEYCIFFGLLLGAMDVFLWAIVFGIRPIGLGSSIAFATNIPTYLLAVLGFLCRSSKILFATISLSVFKMVGFLSFLFILFALEIDEDLVKEDDFIIGNLVGKPKYILYPLFLTYYLFNAAGTMMIYKLYQIAKDSR